MSQDESAYADDELLSEYDDSPSVSTAHGDPAPKRRWGPPWAVLLVCLLVGVVIGVYSVGQRTVPQPTAASGMPTATVDPTVRMAELQALVAADPQNADARLELGAIMFTLPTPDLNGARDQWIAVTVIDSKNAAAWFNLGYYYLMIDPPDYDKAKVAWDTVVEIDPNSELAAQVLNHLPNVFPSSTTPSATPGAGG